MTTTKTRRTLLFMDAVLSANCNPQLWPPCRDYFRDGYAHLIFPWVRIEPRDEGVAR